MLQARSGFLLSGSVALRVTSFPIAAVHVHLVTGRMSQETSVDVDHSDIVIGSAHVPGKSPNLLRKLHIVDLLLHAASASGIDVVVVHGRWNEKVDLTVGSDVTE